MSWQTGVPSTNRPVVAITRLYNGNQWQIHAQYIRRWEKEIESWDLDYGAIEGNADEYSDEKDAYFVKEGWYEITYYHPEYSSLAVDDPVIAWTEMPSMEGVPK